MLSYTHIFVDENVESISSVEPVELVNDIQLQLCIVLLTEASRWNKQAIISNVHNKFNVSKDSKRRKQNDRRDEPNMFSGTIHAPSTTCCRHNTYVYLFLFSLAIHSLAPQPFDIPLKSTYPFSVEHFLHNWFFRFCNCKLVEAQKHKCEYMLFARLSSTTKMRKPTNIHDNVTIRLLCVGNQ